MRRQRSVLLTVLILVVVPAVVAVGLTLLVLNIYDSRQEPEALVLPTTSGTAMVDALGDADLIPGAEGEDSQTPGEEGDGSVTTADGCENPIHVVAGGDTLGGIAEQYGMTIEDLTITNQNVDSEFDANFLSIGQEIVIPQCGVPTPIPTATPTETPVPTRKVPTPYPTGTEPAGGRIEVEIARVVSAGDVANEALEVINQGTAVARLDEWTIVNTRTDDTFTFPPLNLFPQGAVTVYTGTGDNTAIDLYWGLDEAVWQSGDMLELYDSLEQLQDEYEVP